MLARTKSSQNWLPNSASLEVLRVLNEPFGLQVARSRQYLHTLGGGVFVGALFFFFGARFFFCGWLVSARTVPLLQAVAGKSWNFCRVQGFATQHSFWGLGFCNPTLLLGLKVLQPNIPFRASGFCNSTFLLGLKVLQPNTCCKPTLLFGLKVLQPNTPFRA